MEVHKSNELYNNIENIKHIYVTQYLGKHFYINIIYNKLFNKAPGIIISYKSKEEIEVDIKILEQLGFKINL